MKILLEATNIDWKSENGQKALSHVKGLVRFACKDEDKQDKYQKQYCNIVKAFKDKNLLPQDEHTQ